jgi:PhnB protein
VERSRLMSMDGRKLVNGHIEIRGHRLFVCDEFSADEGGTCRCPHTLGGTGVRIMLEVDNADQAVEQAVAAGANVMIPLADMFLGRPLRKTDRSLRS